MHRQLLHRWFVQYNPTYLLSAALVFAGCFLWSRAEVAQATLTSTLAIPAVAEVYALALIGGAALLMRIGQRRTAVMLGLVLVVYQWDTTLHTEACAYLGVVGAWASAVWLALFVAKIVATSWALRIRIAWQGWLALIVAGTGLVVMPRLLPQLTSRDAGGVLALWLFALFASYRAGVITSLESLDAWGQTVLRRVTLATWLMACVLIALHIVMWSSNADVSLAPLVLALPLVALGRVRSEARAWTIVAATLGFAVLVAPSAFWVTALIASASLFLRGISTRFDVAITHEVAAASTPYRATTRPTSPAASHTELTPLSPSERRRAFAGALFTAYLGAWTMRWSHGAWPAHVLALDAILLLTALAAIWRTRATVTFAMPVAVATLHLVLQRGWLPVPTSSIALGETIVGLGFALLGGSLFVSYRVRAVAGPDGPSSTFDQRGKA